MTARGHDAGLTLVEMLVVLAIIGVAAGATMLGLGFGTRGTSTAAEAQRLAATLRLAADDAMLGDRRMAFTWEGSRYAVEGGAAGETPYDAHPLPPGIRLAMARPSGRIEIAGDGSGVPIVARLSGGGEHWIVRDVGATIAAEREPAS